MRSLSLYRALLLLAGLLFPTPLRAEDKPVDPKGAEFFEKSVRPLLAEHCLKCHSAEAEKNNKLKAGLLLDSRAGWQKGGDSGPAILPGKAADSLLLQTLKYDGDVKMPPAGKLPAEAIAAVEKWIAMGAPDPRTETASAPRRQIGLSFEEGRKFWAYQQPVKPALPPGDSANEIDRFIRAALKANGLKPAAPAPKDVLIRRLYYDLAGLPPTPEEVDAFVRDADPKAAEKLVDRLLASPAFGERWGRHWLDIARYADSVTLRGLIFKEAWRYRDYVIDAVNADMPYDRFVREQIAGDLLPAANPAERERMRIATGFFALGNANLEEQDKKALRMDVVDEQLDVISKGILAQTITCARCHDHKFDPIPTADYYALAGILRNAKSMEHANVSRWIEVPLPASADLEAKYAASEKAIADLEARIAKEKAKVAPAKAVLAIKDIAGIVVDDAQAKRVGHWRESKSVKPYIGDGYLEDEDAGKGEKTLSFHPEAIPPGRYEVRLAYTPGTDRAGGVPVTVSDADGNTTVKVDMKKAPPVEGRYVSLGVYRFEKDGLCTVLVSNAGTAGHVTADAVVFVPRDGAEARPAASKGAKDDGVLKGLTAELKALREKGPKRPLAMSVVEEAKIEDARIHIRGSVHNLGDTAPRGFLKVASYGTIPAIPNDQSGRRELAEWIVSPQNPLTARVAVNRAWHHLFGSGLVRSTDNFGTTGERPSHPELLDYLATQFVADGWSLKTVVRRIVLSETYRQSALGDAAAVAADPENRLFGRANLRRRDAEAIRDALLAISGQIDLTRGGPSFPAAYDNDYDKHPNSNRRSVYLPMFRNSMPETLEPFDPADSNVVTGARNASTVAQQALFFMNHAFPREQAKAAAERLLSGESADEKARVERVYRLALGRPPTEGERAVAARFLAGRGDSAEGWAMLFQALFSSVEFRYQN